MLDLPSTENESVIFQTRRDNDSPPRRYPCHCRLSSYDTGCRGPRVAADSAPQHRGLPVRVMHQYPNLSLPYRTAVSKLFHGSADRNLLYLGWVQWSALGNYRLLHKGGYIKLHDAMSALLYRLAAQVWQGLGSDARARTLKLKGTLPACFREGIKEAVRQSTLEAAIQRILASPPHRIPDDDTLQQLRTGWGNEGYSGDLQYLREVARHVLSVDSSVLECGSGVTTILMGLLGSRRGITIWSRED